MILFSASPSLRVSVSSQSACCELLAASCQLSVQDGHGTVLPRFHGFRSSKVALPKKSESVSSASIDNSTRLRKTFTWFAAASSVSSPKECHRSFANLLSLRSREVGKNKAEHVGFNPTQSVALSNVVCKNSSQILDHPISIIIAQLWIGRFQVYPHETKRKVLPHTVSLGELRAPGSPQSLSC